jgi:hypothetical protein
VTFGNLANFPVPINLNRTGYVFQEDGTALGYSDFKGSGVPYIYSIIRSPYLDKRQCIKNKDRDLVACFGFFNNLVLDNTGVVIRETELNPFNAFVEISNRPFFSSILLGSEEILHQLVDDLLRPEFQYGAAYCDTDSDVFADEFEATKNSDLLITTEGCFNSTFLFGKNYVYDGLFYLGPSHAQFMFDSQNSQMIRSGFKNPFILNVSKFARGNTLGTNSLIPATGRLRMELKFMTVQNPILYNNYGSW